MYNIKEYLLKAETSCYAKENNKTGCSFDCGIGENPFGFPETVENSWAAIDIGSLTHYPDSMEFFEALIAYLLPCGNMKEENLALGNGSVELIFKASRMFVGEKRSVLGYLPQFSAVVDDFVNQGAAYHACRLREENNYRFSLDDFLTLAASGDFHLTYIDNPNNPTGQIINLHDIEQIVSFCEKRGTAVFVDEAYGDYFDIEQSAARLVSRYRNLLVFRSFSKGMGLAGLRGGYLISNPDIIRCYKKLSSPYAFSTPARIVAAAALQDDSFLKRCRKTIYNCKKRLQENLHNFRIAETGLEVPISLLYVNDQSFDLQEYLHGYSVHTISGKRFPGLGKNAVRMNLHKNYEGLFDNLFQADRKWRPNNV